MTIIKIQKDAYGDFGVYANGKQFAAYSNLPCAKMRAGEVANIYKTTFLVAQDCYQ